MHEVMPTPFLKKLHNPITRISAGGGIFQYPRKNGHLELLLAKKNQAVF